MTILAIILAILFGTPVILMAASVIKYKIEQARFRHIEQTMWRELRQLIRGIEEDNNGR